MDFIANATGAIFAAAMDAGAAEAGRRQADARRAAEGGPGRVPEGTVRDDVHAADDATATVARPIGRASPRPAARAHRSRGARRAPGRLVVRRCPPCVYAVFVLRPLVLTVQYSLYAGTASASPLGRAWTTTSTVFTDPDLLEIIGNAFQLIVFFSFIPVALGLVVASHHPPDRDRRFGTVVRTILFLPQVIPLVAAGIAWSWLLSSNGLVNQVLRALGLGGVDPRLARRLRLGAARRRRHRRLGPARPLHDAAGHRHDQDRPALYEAARLDGAGPVREFLVVTLPEPAPGDRRLPHRHGHRGAGELRHRLHLDRRRPRPRPPCRASRSTGWPSRSGRWGSPRHSPSCSCCSCSSCVLPIQRLTEGREP